MNATATVKKWRIPASDRKIVDFPLAVSQSEQRRWKLGRVAPPKSEGEWIFFLFCGTLAGVATVPAFTTLFELLNTESLTHFVQRVLH
jgi:hypothetical protein